MSILKLDSSARVNRDATTPGDFQVNLSSAIQGKWDLKSIFICADFPVINSTNNTIPFTESATQKTATVPAGYYTKTTLLTAIGTAMTTASGGTNTYTVTLDSVTQSVTITASTVPFTLDWLSRSTNSMARLLGFAVTTNTASALTATGSGILVLNTVLSFNIAIEGVGTIVNAQGQLSTFYVPMTANVGTQGWIQYEPDQFDQRITIPSPLSTLRIRVLDDNGRVLPIRQDWQMLIGKLETF
jgi:hypothetical protein